MIHKLINFYDDLYDDLCRNAVNFVLVTLQIIVICFFSGLLLNQYEDYSKVKSIMEQIDGKDNTYIFTNHSSGYEEYVFTRGKSEMFELYNSITSNPDIEYMVVENSNDYILGNRALSVTKNFFDLYNINGEFIESSEYIPIVMGYNVGKGYKKGQIIQDEFHKEKKYIVSDIIEKESYYVSPKDSPYPECIDDSILILFDEKKYDLVSQENVVQMYATVMNTSVIIKDTCVRDELVKQMDELGFSGIELESYQYRKKILKDTNLEDIKLNMFISVILIVFLFINTVSFLIQYVADNQRRFSIEIICGRPKSYILFRIIMRQCISVTAGIVFSVMLLRQTTHIVYILLGYAVYITVVMVYPVMAIRRKRICV